MTLPGDGRPVVQSAQGERRPRIALLTRGTRHAAGILDALREHGTSPDAILLERPAGRQLLDRLRDVRRRRGLRATIGAVARRIAARLRPGEEPWLSAGFYADRTDRLIAVPSLAGPEAVAALEDLRPDLLVLGGAPILPDAVLGTATHGTLNAHPGLLPRYRGVDVVPHAVLNGDPVGATVHFVDTGIDTGRIVARVEVEPLPGDTIATLQQRVEAAGGALLAAVVARFVADGLIPSEGQSERHPICRRLTPARRREAEARLRGLA
jgi:methionyl-tRNA formyltransferase